MVDFEEWEYPLTPAYTTITIIEETTISPGYYEQLVQVTR